MGKLFCVNLINNPKCLGTYFSVIIFPFHKELLIESEIKTMFISVYISHLEFIISYPFF